MQFGIKNILIATFAAAVVMSIFVQGGPFVVNILLSVLLANFVGVVVALLVTFVFRFPRDGSLRDAAVSANEEAE